MKIVFFINSMAGGGAERVVSTLSTYLTQEKGAEITILTMSMPKCAYELPSSVSVQQLKTGFLCRGIWKLVFMPLVAMELARVLKKNKPDATLSLLVRANLIHLMSKWLGNKSRIAISERADSETHYSAGGLANKIMKILIRRLYSTADIIIPISEGVQVALENLGVDNDNIIPIHNPQNIRHIVQQSKEVCDIPLPKNIPTLVTIGRLDYQKDYPTMLDAMKKIKDALDVHLVILGEGPLESKLKTYAQELGLSENISWVGWKKNPFSIMAQSDIFVFTSAYEGFGNVLVEGMTCGLPIITTDCPSGPAEILENGKYGVLVPVGDSDAFADEVINLLQHDDQYENFKRLSAERAMAFDVPKVAEKYLDCLNLR